MSELSTATELGSDSNGLDLVSRNSVAPAAEFFVINLCASMTPMPSVPKSLEGFERYKLYQVSKMEDGRRRYRLRLGFFTSEADAEMVVGSVRNLYPAAFTGCLTEEDVRFTNGFLAPTASAAKSSVTEKPVLAVVATAPAPIQPRVEAAKPPPVAAKSSPSAQPVATPAKPQPAIAPTPVATKAPVIQLSSAAPSAVPEPEEITLELDHSKPAIPAPAASNGPAEPFHVGKGVVVPETTLQLIPEPSAAAKPLPAAAAPPAAKAPAKPATATKTPSFDRPLPPPPQIIDDYIPVLDTTLTLRTLTQKEIEDPNQPTWFVVQLALSENPVNLDTMPKLDIFAAYALYSVATMQPGGIRHALRLGFFSEAVSAEAVSGYLKTFFSEPSVTRVSAAEHSRFAEPPRRAPAPPDKSNDKVVQLKDKRPAASAPAATPQATNAAQSKSTIAKPAAEAKKPATLPKTVKKGKPGAARSLADELKEEARQTILSESAIRKMPKPQSFLSRLIGRSLD